MAKEKDRIIALQKQLRIARETLALIARGAYSYPSSGAEEAIERMNQIEWASKPNLVQERVR